MKTWYARDDGYRVPLVWWCIHMSLFVDLVDPTNVLGPGLVRYARDKEVEDVLVELIGDTCEPREFL